MNSKIRLHEIFSDLNNIYNNLAYLRDEEYTKELKEAKDKILVLMSEVQDLLKGDF